MRVFRVRAFWLAMFKCTRCPLRKSEDCKGLRSAVGREEQLHLRASRRSGDLLCPVEVGSECQAEIRGDVLIAHCCAIYPLINHGQMGATREDDRHSPRPPERNHGDTERTS